MDRIDRIIIPHTEAEFTPALPSRLAPRASYVGTIARRPDESTVAALRAGRDGGVFVTSTAGGGGFGPQTDRFFELVAAATEAMAELISGLRHVVVLGPRYANHDMIRRLSRLPGTQVLQTSTCLVELLAASDLVVAEAGYNTVAELRVVRVPSVVVPAARTLDDQLERARRFAADGAAMMLTPDLDEADFADRVAALANDPARLAAMRKAASPVDLGNDRAAQILVELARSPR